MLVDCQLVPADQLTNMIKDYLIQCANDSIDFEIQEHHITQVRLLLKKKHLVISFSEQDESIGIVNADDIGVDGSKLWPSEESS